MALKVLLADDSVPAQNMGKKILTDAGYEVLAVSNGLEALKKIADNVPDIAILDIFMPGYTGLEVCSRLRGNAVTAALPVILTVGKLEPYRPEDGEKVHSNAVIVKPFASNELISAVRSLVGLPFAIRPEDVQAKAPAAPASTTELEDDYQEEAPMLAGVGFDPDIKRTPFSASAVQEASAASAKTMTAFETAFETMASADVPAVSSAYTDFGMAPEANLFGQTEGGLAEMARPAAGSTAATATALVEWWQSTPESVEQADDLELADEVERSAAAHEAVALTPTVTEAHSVHDFSEQALAQPGPAEIEHYAVDEIQPEANKRTAIEPPATQPEASSPAAEADVVEDSAQPIMASADEVPAPDREARLQAFEALFNSAEAIPVQENPAALPDLLAEEELEASLEEASETVPPLALEEEPDEGLPIAAASATASEDDVLADAAHELHLDAESISDWLTTGTIPNEPKPPVAAAVEQAGAEHATDPEPAVESSPAQPVVACDSFYSGVPDDTESLHSESVDAAGEVAGVCYLPQESATESLSEASTCASLDPAATEFINAETLIPQIEAPQTEAPQAEAQDFNASLPPQPVPAYAEAVAPGVLEQIASEAESEQTGDEGADECERVSAEANPGGDAKRIHQAVESVFDRFRPLLIAAIARELTRQE